MFDHEIRSALLRAIGEVADALEKIKEPKRLVIQEDGWRVTVLIRPVLPTGKPGTRRQTTGTQRDNGQTFHKVSPAVRAEIIDGLGDATLSAKELAAKLGRANSGHFRDLLAALRDEGTLTKEVDGYRLGDV